MMLGNDLDSDYPFSDYYTHSNGNVVIKARYHLKPH